MNYQEEIHKLKLKQEEERNKIAKELIPKFEKEWVGRCFKFKNCYSCPKSSKDYWFIYARIEKIEGINFYNEEIPEPNFYILSFENDKQGRVTFEYDKYHLRMQDWKEITTEEFDKQFNKTIGFLINKQICSSSCV